MFTTSAIFTCATAPADAFAAAPPSGAACRDCRTTPSAPAASTVRRIAPTLCGSSMPSSTTMSGAPRAPVTRSSTLVRAALARRRRRRPDARRRRASAIELVGAHALHRHALRLGQPHDRRQRDRRRAATTRSDVDAPRAQRFEDRVDAVDQHGLTARGPTPARELDARCSRARARGYAAPLQRARERRRALAAAEDRRDARAARQLRAAIDRRHGEIELRALRRARSARRESDGTAPSPFCPVRAFTWFATARNRSRSSRGAAASSSASAAHDGARAVGAASRRARRRRRAPLRRRSRTGTPAAPAPD